MDSRRAELLLTENDMAAVAAGEVALQRLWVRLRAVCRKPMLGMDDIEVIGEELREVEAGLAAGRRALVALRERE